MSKTGGPSSVFCFQAITGIDADVPGPTGQLLETEYILGTDQAVSREMAQLFAEHAGGERADQMREASTFAYHAAKYPVGTLTEPETEEFLEIFNARTQLLLLSLWLVKDNSANGERAFLNVNDPAGHRFRGGEWYIRCTTVSGDEIHTRYSREEVATAVDFYRKLHTSAILRRDAQQPSASGLIYSSRVGRCLYLLQACRGSGDLLVKIAFYCMCLESLFSTDKEGITYRIAERTALFLGKDGPERRAIFDDVSKLYATRSKVVHGDIVKKSQLPDLLERVKRGDDYLRRCITKIVDESATLALFSNKPNEAIIEHFKAQVFDK